MNPIITIGLAGDVMLGRVLDDIITDRGYEYPWGDMLPEFRQTNLNLINLETTFTNSEQKVLKTFNFKATPDKVQSLLAANITVANLANNHIFDFAEEGFVETLHVLDNAGIAHVGAGMNWDEAIRPVVLRKKGMRIGILGFTDNEPGWEANARSGICYINLPDEQAQQKILRAIEKLCSQTDVVIVSVHWGPNMAEEPSAVQKRFAHAMIDCGADVIHGHSAHILQGIEKYKNRWILYDTGDFVDDYMVDPVLRNDLSAFFILTVTKDKPPTLKLIPTHINAYRVQHATGEDYRWVIHRLQQLSAKYGTTINDQGEVE